MNITINIDTNAATGTRKLEATVLRALASALDGTEGVSLAAQTAPDVATAPAADKPKRQTKAEKEAAAAALSVPAAADAGIFGDTSAPAAKAPAAATAQTATPTPPTAEVTTAAGGKISGDMLRQKVLDASQKLQAVDVINMVEKLTGKRKASEVPPEKFEEVIAALDNMLAAHEAAS